jgi:choline transport protein
MYSLYHPNYVIQAWHIFVVLVIITWICIAATIFFNKYLPYLQQFGLLVVLVGGLATIIVIAAMPKSHASNSFVWSDWANNTGWPSGFAFLSGVLNGAFTIGTPDAVTHMAEEVSQTSGIPDSFLSSDEDLLLLFSTRSVFLSLSRRSDADSEILKVPNPRKDLPKAIAAQIILGAICMSNLSLF